MNHNTLCILALLSIFFVQKTLCADLHYEVCKVHKYCGDQLIKYPFYIKNEQESYCGYPGFEVSCKNNKTMIKLTNDSDDDYIIRELFYQNQILRVSNAAFGSSDRNRCFPNIHNITNSSLRREFNMTTYPGDMYLLYNCSIPDGIGNLSGYYCNSGNESVVTLGMSFRDRNFNDVSKNCAQRVRVPVEVGYGGEEGFRIEMFGKGFMLNWTAGSCNECEQVGGLCGFDPDRYNFLCSYADLSMPGNDKLNLTIGLGIGFPTIFMIGFLVSFFKCGCKRKHRSTNKFSTTTSQADLEEGSVCYGVPVFSYNELEEATKNFDDSNELGKGGFGIVYYGKLKDGREVAVKRLFNKAKRVEQFMNEIEILTRLSHTNLVSLYGYTPRQSHELLLVYEYIPNGTVADHLHGNLAKTGSLAWSTRMSIAIETTKALANLHASDIIHRDIKTNNILRHNNFSVKVVDFGISRLFPIDVTLVSTPPQGIFGYLDPDYYQSFQLTDKSDVFSFGVVLVELISSMPAVDISRHSDEIGLRQLAIAKIKKRAYNELVDPTLDFESDSSIRKMVMMVADLAFRCLQLDKKMRPSMDEVLEALQEIKSGKSELVSLDEAHTENI